MSHFTITSSPLLQNATLEAERQATQAQLRQLESQSDGQQAQILALQRQAASLQENNTALQTHNANLQVTLQQALFSVVHKTYTQVYSRLCKSMQACRQYALKCYINS